MAPPVPARPAVTNVGACRVDLIWEPPGDPFQQLTVTGYKILWFQPEFRTRVSNLTVGTYSYHMSSRPCLAWPGRLCCP